MLSVFFSADSGFTASAAHPAALQLLKMAEQLEYAEEMSARAGDETGAALARLARRKIAEVVQGYLETLHKIS